MGSRTHNPNRRGNEHALSHDLPQRPASLQSTIQNHARTVARRIALLLGLVLTALLVLIPVAERIAIGEPVWPPLHPPIPVLVYGVLIDLRWMPVFVIGVWMIWLLLHLGAKPVHRLPRGARMIIATLVTLLMLAESGMCLLSLAFGAERLHVLSPTGPNGCTVIATYGSTLWSSNGDFLIVPRGHIVPRNTDAGWMHRDGSANDPFGDPAWTIEWNGNAATPTPDNPYLVSTYRTPVHCE